MKKAKDFRDLSIEELEANYHDARKEMFHLTNEIKLTKKAEKPHKLPQKKKEIARLLTIISEKQSAK